MRALFAFVFVLSSIPCVEAAAPAARAGDPTTHGGVIVTGSATVHIGGLPAARLTDTATCPLSEGSPPVAHVGGPIVGGSATVLVNGRPAARVGDAIAEAAGPGSAIAAGQPTVLIGTTGSRRP
jgi:uncharacterized Zn-binding protein involved in type VI secretion